jgi:hypothetical protein
MEKTLKKFIHGSVVNNTESAFRVNDNMEFVCVYGCNPCCFLYFLIVHMIRVTIFVLVYSIYLFAGRSVLMLVIAWRKLERGSIKCSTPVCLAQAWLRINKKLVSQYYNLPLFKTWSYCTPFTVSFLCNFCFEKLIALYSTDSGKTHLSHIYYGLYIFVGPGSFAISC